MTPKTVEEILEKLKIAYEKLYYEKKDTLEPEDQLPELRTRIELAQNELDLLQETHRIWTGRRYVPPLRLKF